jgi:hypothetical protein
MQDVNVVGIRKISSVEDDNLEIEVRSPISGMDAIDRHKVLQGPLAE